MLVLLTQLTNIVRGRRFTAPFQQKVGHRKCELSDLAVYRLVFGSKLETAGRFQLDEKGVHKMYTPTNGGTQELTFVSEPNLYRVIFRSNKEQAKQFQDWVFSEVLPQIRRTGVYEGQAPTPTDPLLLIAHLAQSAYEIQQKQVEMDWDGKEGVELFGHTPIGGAIVQMERGIGVRSMDWGGKEGVALFGETPRSPACRRKSQNRPRTAGEH